MCVCAYKNILYWSLQCLQQEESLLALSHRTSSCQQQDSFPVSGLSTPAMHFQCTGLDSTNTDCNYLEDAVIHAIMTENTEYVQRLVGMGVTVSPPNAWIIFEACLQGLQMIDAISSNSQIDLNLVLPRQGGDRVFHFLLRTPPNRFRSGKNETVNALLLKGVDPFAPDSRGNTALHILAGITTTPDDCRKLFNLLCSTKRPVKDIINTRNRSGVLGLVDGGGDTALHTAVRNNNWCCTYQLLGHGANPSLRGEFQKTPLSLAVSRNSINMATLLLTYGAAVEKDAIALSPEMKETLARIQSSEHHTVLD